MKCRRNTDKRQKQVSSSIHYQIPPYNDISLRFPHYLITYQSINQSINSIQLSFSVSFFSQRHVWFAGNKLVLNHYHIRQQIDRHKIINHPDNWFRCTTVYHRFIIIAIVTIENCIYVWQY